MRLVLPLAAIAALLAGCSAPPADEGRDHVWVVDHTGKEVSLAGAWSVVEAAHPNATHPVGKSIVFPPSPPPAGFSSEGTYTDPMGTTWTKVSVKITDEIHLRILERVDASVTPHRLHVVTRVADGGSLLAEYPEHPFDAPEDDYFIAERVSGA